MAEIILEKGDCFSFLGVRFGRGYGVVLDEEATNFLLLYKITHPDLAWKLEKSHNLPKYLEDVYSASERGELPNVVNLVFEAALLVSS